MREFYLQRREAELPAFLRVLRALPADRLDYKPHERSPSAEQLVLTLTGELKSCVDAARRHRAQWEAVSPRPLPELIELFEGWYRDLSDAVAAMNDDGWNQPAEFYFNGRLVSQQPAGQFLWFIHFDAIHHRGQLSAYLRPMGGRVPAIYGPSADERPVAPT